MKKHKLYLFTFLAITIVVVASGILGAHQLYQTSKYSLLKEHLDENSRQARVIAKLLEASLENGISKKEVINNLQKSIENTDTNTGFICMYNQQGIELCHPNPQKIGQRISLQDSKVSLLNTPKSENFLQALKAGKKYGGFRDFINTDRPSEIIYIYPVKNTNWMVASHSNINRINEKLYELKYYFFLISILTFLSIIFLSYSIVRFLNRNYEKTLETENQNLAQEINSLYYLNNKVQEYKKRIEQLTAEKMLITVFGIDSNSSEITQNGFQSRILTYYRDQLIPIKLDETAFFYIEHATTYLYNLKGQRFSTNTSLEELNTQLPPIEFFRVNRQYILSIKSINKIYRYGKNQLKITTIPESPEAIIISKNKAAEFKKWLNS